MHDVISAFLDNEPFDPRELADALATPDGRDLLLDMVAMRALVQVPDVVDVPVAAAIVVPRSDSHRNWRGWVLAAAAVLVAAVAGYGAGREVTPSHAPVPEATSVFTFQPGVNWTETPSEGGN